MAALRYALIVAGLGLLAGCSSRTGGGESAGQAVVLQEVNDLLHAAAGTTNRLPARLADVPGRLQQLYPRAYEAVKSGAVVVLWGAPLKGEEDVGKDEAVVAYDKTVPTEGGYVLLSAGSLKKMSAAEFNAAPKAGKQ
jgi:uncharacterized coiled-coil protein SlyX